MYYLKNNTQFPENEGGEKLRITRVSYKEG